MPKILNILLGLFTRNLRSNILIMALVAIWIGFGIATPTFWSADNIQNVLPQMAIIAIMACGMVFVIVTGGIDLSVGFGAGFVSVVAAALLYFGVIDRPLQSLFPTLASARLELVTMLITVILCMGLGLLMGLFQGYIIAQAGFQYCHGFAFISKQGAGFQADNLAMGYLAIVLDKPNTLPRTFSIGENDGH